ncbi:MAG: hypothetical protein AAGM84_05535 [Pseudomonadota bacterium]
MGFAENATTIASHALMIVVLVQLLYRVVLAFEARRALEAVRSHGLMLALGIMAAFTLLERSYYLIARLIQNTGVDLWSMHPAPEVLSAIMALGIYCVQVPLLAAHQAEPLPDGALRRRVMIELMVLGLVWGLIVAALR